MSGMASAGVIAGGIGLALLGLRLWTEGLRVVGGALLEGRLAEGVGGRRRGFVTGLVAGLTTPASSTLTSALMGLPAAAVAVAWVLAGASVGAALLTPLVALAALTPDIHVVSLAAVALGVVVASSGLVTDRFAFAGRAALGLGVLLVGGWLASLGLAEFRGLRLDAADVPFAALAACAVLAGVALSAGLRSACAAGVLVVLAADAGLLATASAAAALVGVGLGTTAPALAALREPTRVRPAALAQALQQSWIAMTGLVLLGCALPVLLDPPAYFAEPAALLTVFLGATHTVGVLGWHVVGPPLVAAIELRLSAVVEDEAPPIEPRELLVPDLGVVAVETALRRQCDLTLRSSRRLLGGEQLSRFRSVKVRSELVRASLAIDDAVRRLGEGPLTRPMRAFLVDAPRWALTLSELGDRAMAHVPFAPGDDQLFGRELASRLRHVQLTALHLVEGCVTFRSRCTPADHRGELGSIERHLEDCEQRLLARCTIGQIGPVDCARTLRRLGELRGLAVKAIEVAERRESAREHLEATPAEPRLLAWLDRRLHRATPQPA